MRQRVTDLELDVSILVTRVGDLEDTVEELEATVEELKPAKLLPTWEPTVRRIIAGGWDDLALVHWIADQWPEWERNAWLALNNRTPREMRIANMVRRVCSP